MEENRPKTSGPPRRGRRPQGNQQRKPERRDQPQQPQRESYQNRSERPPRTQYVPKKYPRIRLSTKIEDIQLNEEQKEQVVKYNTELKEIGKPQAPNKEEKEAQLNKISLELSKLEESKKLINDKIESLKIKRTEIFEKNNPEVVAIKQKREEMKRLDDEFHKLTELRAKTRTRMTQIKESQTTQQKRLGFKTKEDAEEAIDDIEYQIENSSLNNRELKTKLARIDEIKKKLPLFEKYQAGANEMDSEREKIDAISNQIEDNRKRKDQLYEEIKILNETKKPKQNQQDDINKEIDAQYDKLKGINKSIRATREQKDLISKEFSEKMDEYHKKTERFYELTYLRDSIYSEAEKRNLQMKEAERLIGHIVERENPHKAEITAGKALIAYLSSIVKPEEAPKEAEHQHYTQISSLENQLNDMLGGIQKKKPKAARKQKKETPTLTLPLETHGQFASLGMIPPKTVEEIPALLEKLDKMVKAYEADFVKLRLNFAVEDNGHVSVKIDYE